MDNEKEEIIPEEEEDCKPLTDEEFAEFQKKEKTVYGFGKTHNCYSFIMAEEGS